MIGLAALGLSGCSGNGAGQKTLDRLHGVSANRIWQDATLRPIAEKLGSDAYQAHCAECHGIDLKGLPDHHTPDLTDGHWLYGGDDIDAFVIHPADIEKTILHGIHAADPQSRNLAVMPAKGTGHSLDGQEIADVAEYVLKLSHQPFDARRLKAGREVYEGEGGCYDCHTVDGIGDAAIGATELTVPQTWLYGHDRASIVRTVTEGRKGISPAFAGKLKPEETKSIAVFLLSRASSAKF